VFSIEYLQLFKNFRLTLHDLQTPDQGLIFHFSFSQQIISVTADLMMIFIAAYSAGIAPRNRILNSPQDSHVKNISINGMLDLSFFARLQN
jgi:hypothetical protein